MSGHENPINIEKGAGINKVAEARQRAKDIANLMRGEDGDIPTIPVNKGALGPDDRVRPPAAGLLPGTLQGRPFRRGHADVAATIRQKWLCEYRQECRYQCPCCCIRFEYSRPVFVPVLSGLQDLGPLRRWRAAIDECDRAERQQHGDRLHPTGTSIVTNINSCQTTHGIGNICHPRILEAF